MISYPISNVSAVFQDPYWSARAASLGGAFHAVSDDSSGVFYNAAALKKISKKQCGFGYARLFSGLDEVQLSVSQFAYVQPLFNDIIAGIGWGTLDSSDLYREDRVTVSAAYDLTNLFSRAVKEFSMGVSASYLTRGFDIDGRAAQDPVFRNGSRNHSAAVDLHFYSVPDEQTLPGFSLAFSLKSINQPDVGFHQQEKLPMEIVGGLLYQWKNISFPLEIRRRSGTNEPHLGGEVFLWDRKIALRAGSDLAQFGGGFGYDHKLTERFSLVLDYAFLWPLEVEQTAGSHRANFGVRF